MPANCIVFFLAIRKIVSFGILPYSSWYDKYTGTSIVEEAFPDCEAMNEIGYSTIWSLRNCGSFAIFTSITLLTMIFTCIANCLCKCDWHWCPCYKQISEKCLTRYVKTGEKGARVKFKERKFKTLFNIAHNNCLFFFLLGAINVKNEFEPTHFKLYFINLFVAYSLLIAIVSVPILIIGFVFKENLWYRHHQLFR